MWVPTVPWMPLVPPPTHHIPSTLPHQAHPFPSLSPPPILTHSPATPTHKLPLSSISIELIHLIFTLIIALQVRQLALAPLFGAHTLPPLPAPTPAQQTAEVEPTRPPLVVPFARQLLEFELHCNGIGKKGFGMRMFPVYYQTDKTKPRLE